MRNRYESLYKRADEIRSDFKPLDDAKTVTPRKQKGLMAGASYKSDETVVQPSPLDQWKAAMRGEE